MHKPSNETLRSHLFDSGPVESKNDAASRSDVTRESQLLHARKEMETELQRMRSTTAVIEESSRTIGSVNEKYTMYGSSLSKATKTLKALKTKMENDDKYIYYSFVFFLCVSGYVLLKRVKVIAITSWFASKFYGVGNWITDAHPEQIPSTTTTQTGTRTTTTLLARDHPMMAPTNATKRDPVVNIDEEL